MPTSINYFISLSVWKSKGITNKKRSVTSNVGYPYFVEKLCVSDRCKEVVWTRNFGDTCVFLSKKKGNINALMSNPMS